MKTHLLILSLSLFLSCFAQEGKTPYPEFLKHVIAQRDSFKSDYVKANSLGKDSILNQARIYLTKTLSEDIFPYWYGTKWDFNGTTRTPQKGKIACGYFITNILSDIGLKIPRTKWAQSPSEVFIKKLAFGNLNRFSNKPISEIKDFLKKKGEGLYVVGLDYHVGFVLVTKEKIRFIHADYYEPDIGVVSEEIDSFSPINDSSYRVFGKLMEKQMIINWIQGISFN